MNHINIGWRIAGIMLCLSAFPSRAQLAISANDGKQPRSGELAFQASPDTISVIDLDHYPPKVRGMVAVATSLIGPPTSVVVARDESFAIITAAQMRDPADLTKFIPSRAVSVVDLANPDQPLLVQTIAAGDGASGVSINRAGTLAMVAGNIDGSISVYGIANKRLTLLQTLQLNRQLGAADVALSADGRTALVTQRRGDSIHRLTIRDRKLVDDGVTISTGGNPYGAVFGRNDRYAFNVNLLGNGPTPRPATGASVPRLGTVTVVDLKTNKVVNAIEVGTGPEHLGLSPDGRYLAVVVVNGSAASPKSPAHGPFGLLKVYRVTGARLALTAEAATGAWVQGAAWSNDGQTILVQSAAARQIEIWRFTDNTLTRDERATLRFDARPAAISTATSR